MESISNQQEKWNRDQLGGDDDDDDDNDDDDDDENYDDDIVDAGGSMCWRARASWRRRWQSRDWQLSKSKKKQR